MSEKGLKILSMATGNVRYKLTNDYLFRAVLQKNPKALRGLVGALLNLQQKIRGRRLRCWQRRMNISKKQQ